LCGFWRKGGPRVVVAANGKDGRDALEKDNLGLNLDGRLEAGNGRV